MNMEEIKKMIAERAKEAPAQKINCNLCGDTGYIEWEEDGYVYGKKCVCQMGREEREKMERAGLAAGGKTFATYYDREPWQKKIKAAAMQYARTANGEWFYLCGQTGAGKTHLCKAITAEIIARGTRVMAVKWPQFTAEIKAAANTPEYMMMINKATEVNTLYIDDLFKGGITEADVKLLFMILDGRGGKKTIISSEYTVEQVRAVDPAIMGRIEEFARGYVYDVGLNTNRDARRNEQLRIA